MSKQTFGILGLGLFGAALAKTLAQDGFEVIAMDKNMNHVEEVADVVDQCVQGDFTKLDHLREAGVGNCDVVIIATSQMLEDAIIAIMNLKKLQVKNIIVKSKNLAYRDVLLKVGAQRVVLPEVEMGMSIGKQLAKAANDSQSKKI